MPPETEAATALFLNRDRIRVAGTDVVHLRTGRTATLLNGASVDTMVRVHLKDLTESPDEIIDLATQATPPVPNATFKNTTIATGQQEMLAELASLPTAKNGRRTRRRVTCSSRRWMAMAMATCRSPRLTAA